MSGQRIGDWKDMWPSLGEGISCGALPPWTMPWVLVCIYRTDTGPTRVGKYVRAFLNRLVSLVSSVRLRYHYPALDRWIVVYGFTGSRNWSGLSLARFASTCHLTRTITVFSTSWATCSWSVHSRSRCCSLRCRATSRSTVRWQLPVSLAFLPSTRASEWV